MSVPMLDFGLMLKQATGDPLDAEEQARWDAYAAAEAAAEERRSALGLVDMAEVLREGVEETAMLIDGLLVAAAHHLIYGTKESAKTWLLLAAVALLLKQGKTVIWIDEEMGRADIALRLAALGVTDEDAEHLVYLEYPALDGSKANIALWRALLEAHAPVLVVVDAQTEVLAAADLNENSGTDVAKWYTWYMAPARRLGAATVFIDHTGHDDQGRAVSSRQKGAQSKVELAVVCKQKFDKSNLGMIEVTRTKNTHSAPIPLVQRFKLGGDGEGRFVFYEYFGPAESTESTRKTDLKLRIETVIREKGPLYKSQVEDMVKARKTDIRDALTELAESTLSSVSAAPGDRAKSVVYSWTAPDADVEETVPKSGGTAETGSHIDRSVGA